MIVFEREGERQESILREPDSYNRKLVDMVRNDYRGCCLGDENYETPWTVKNVLFAFAA